MKRREMYAAFVTALITRGFCSDEKGTFAGALISNAANDLCDQYRPERVHPRDPKTGRFANATAEAHAKAEAEYVAQNGFRSFKQEGSADV